MDTKKEVSQSQVVGALRHLVFASSSVISFLRQASLS